MGPCRRQADKTTDSAVPGGQFTEEHPGNETASYNWYPVARLDAAARRSSIRDADGLRRNATMRFQWVRYDPMTGVEENVQGPESPGWWWGYWTRTSDLRDVNLRRSS